jgi:hypothetical protein
MPKLLVNPGTEQQWEIRLQAGTNTIGRNESNRFRIDHTSVSGSHCEIIVANGSTTVRDLGSTNGTFINRAPIQEALLEPGQRLQLGAIEMLYEQGPVPVAVPVAAAVPLAAAPTQGPTPPSGVRLRLSGVAAESAALPTPPTISTPTAPAATTAPMFCKFHLKSPARHYCGHCRHAFCDLCVSARATSSGTGHFCRACGTECQELALHLATEEAPKGFFASVPGAFAFPFKGSGGFMLVIGAILYAAINFAKGFSLYLQIVFWGYMFAYMQNVIISAAQGDDKPSWPDVTDFIGDILVPCFRLLVMIAACFAPAIAIVIWGLAGGEGVLKLLIPAVVLGCLYFPMTLLAVAMFDTIGAVNPLVIVPAIIKVPLEYLVVCVLTAMIAAVRFGGDLILPLAIPVIIVPDLISAFLGLYLLTVETRILGLLYYTKKERLGWFG